MQRASNRRGDDEAVREMSLVVRATRADGEEASAGSHDRDFLVADGAFDCRIRVEATDRNALGEIGQLSRL